ncbi:UMP-CMP kinase 2, mitochondrial isoform 2-T2 [Synchiropus picturatus]
MARRMVSLLPLWRSRTFSVHLDGDRVHFRLQESPAARDAPAVFGAVTATERCYSLLVYSADRIQKAKFYPELKDKLLAGLPPQCDLSHMTSHVPHARDSLLKGYFIKDSSKNSASTERFLEHLQQHDPVLVCSYSRAADDGAWTQQLWSEDLTNTSKCFHLVPTEEPECHPSILNIINSDVFYSFQEALNILKQCGDIIPEATSVLQLLPSRVECRSKADFPVIVLEGLDATGKTTLTESLRDTLGAALLYSPPKCLSPWRARFDQEPPLIRRAFYALGNYITAQQIGQEGLKRPVIVDRFWHSTAAYAIATAVDGPVSSLPHQGSEVYLWPGDLLQPDLVVVLTLDPEERKRRLKNRGQGATQEENALERDRLFRLRVEEAYQRIIGPPCVTVDASSSADQVLQNVLRLIQAKCSL